VMTTNKRPVKIEEILSMCKTIAYKRQDQYEDLVSEGVLVALELQEKEPNIAFSSIYMSVNKRMHDYLNIDLLPVQGIQIPLRRKWGIILGRKRALATLRQYSKVVMFP
jgi:hypothetical protein